MLWFSAVSGACVLSVVVCLLFRLFCIFDRLCSVSVLFVDLFYAILTCLFQMVLELKWKN